MTSPLKPVTEAAKGSDKCQPIANWQGPGMVLLSGVGRVPFGFTTIFGLARAGRRGTIAVAFASMEEVKWPEDERRAPRIRKRFAPHPFCFAP